VIEGRELPTTAVRCTCSGDALDVLFVPPERFRRRPQTGVACRMSWAQLAQYLATPTLGAAKDAAGAWSPARYRDDKRRKANLVHACALVVDVDEGGDVGNVADALRRYRSIVHSTFSSTRDAPRCRIVLALAAPIDADTYARVHSVVRAHLLAAGIVADDGAKDASRLSYSPVGRHGGAFDCRTTAGEPLDACAVLALAAAPPSRPLPPPLSVSADRYARAALEHAAVTIASANPGARHAALSREAFKLARLDLSALDIERALLPAFVASAGDARATEGARTIRDAIRARRSQP
jgi:hypothetical protein